MNNWYDGFLLDKNNCIVGFNEDDKTISQRCIFDEITHGMFTVYKVKKYDPCYKYVVNQLYTLCNDKLLYTGYINPYHDIKLEDIIFKKDYYFYITHDGYAPTLVLVYYKANHIVVNSIMFQKSNENNIVENLKKLNYYSDADKWIKQNIYKFYERFQYTYNDIC